MLNPAELPITFKTSLGSLEITATQKLPKYEISEEANTKANYKNNVTAKQKKKKKKITANSVSLYKVLKYVTSN